MTMINNKKATKTLVVALMITNMLGISPILNTGNLTIIETCRSYKQDLNLVNSVIDIIDTPFPVKN